MSEHDDGRAQRYKVGGLRVIYDTGDGYWSGRVVDVSESGIFVETTHELEPGTRVTLLPDAADEDELPFEVTAEVARLNVYDLEEHYDRTPGIAFRWVDLDDAQRAQVRAYLEAHGVPVRAS